MPRGDKPTTAALALRDGWIYEDALPADIGKAQYDWWFRESLVLSGVRMGPPLPDNEQTTLEPCPWCKAEPRELGHYFEVFHKPGCFLSEPGTELTRKLIHADKFTAWNNRVSADSTAPVVDRSLYSELIHIAAELARGDGFLSTSAEDMNPRLKRADILKTAERQEQRLKDWAYRVRRVADKLSPAAASPAAPARSVQHLVNQWQAAWLSTQDISRGSEADLVRRIEAFTAPAAPQEDAGSRTQCTAACKHKFCKECYEIDECCKCSKDIPPRTVAERLAQHEHIEIVDGVLGGVNPLVSRTRISVHHILSYLYNGESVESIAQNYQLTPDAIKDAIAFAQDVYDDAVASALRAPRPETVGLRTNPRVNALLVALLKVRDKVPTLEAAQAIATIAIEEYVAAGNSTST